MRVGLVCENLHFLMMNEMKTWFASGGMSGSVYVLIFY